MKSSIIITLLLIATALRAQTIENPAAIISCGGAITSNGTFESTVSIGLPCIGLLSNGSDEQMLGMAIPPPPEDNNKSVSIVGDSGLLVSPNPTTGRISVTVPNGFGRIQSMQLIDDAARVVVFYQPVATATFVYDFSHVNNGVYFLRIAGSTASLTKTIVIHH